MNIILAYGINMNKNECDQIVKKVSGMKYVYKSTIDFYVKPFSKKEKDYVYSLLKSKLGEYFIESQ